MSDGTIHRNATVDMDDALGFWVAQATSDIAGTWWAASRSGEMAIGLAVYSTMFGEPPQSDWEPGDNRSAFAVSMNRDEVIALQQHRERIQTLLWRDIPKEIAAYAVELRNDHSLLALPRLLTDEFGIENREPIDRCVTQLHKIELSQPR